MSSAFLSKLQSTCQQEHLGKEIIFRGNALCVSALTFRQKCRTSGEFFSASCQGCILNFQSLLLKKLFPFENFFSNLFRTLSGMLSETCREVFIRNSKTGFFLSERVLWGNFIFFQKKIFKILVILSEKSWRTVLILGQWAKIYQLLTSIFRQVCQNCILHVHGVFWEFHSKIFFVFLSIFGHIERRVISFPSERFRQACQNCIPIIQRNLLRDFFSKTYAFKSIEFESLRPSGNCFSAETSKLHRKCTKD